jgi:hypothetical protein
MKIKKRRGGWSASLGRKHMSKKVLLGHYEWCKKEGRDTSWYDRSGR